MHLNTFVIAPRSHAVQTAWCDIAATIAFAHRFGVTGVLAFAGNDVMVDPWFAALYACQTTSALKPLIAVNPIYMHPFQVAKLVSTIAYVYRRRVFLNLITGTANRDRVTLVDTLDHDARYDRLVEFGRIVWALLSQATPVRFEGRYYHLNGAQCVPRPSIELLPGFFVTGQSEAAMRCASPLDAVSMTMLPQSYSNLPPASGRRGLYFGVIVREDADEAWKTAVSRFPPNPEGEFLDEIALARTDLAWKHQLSALAHSHADDGFYWLHPLRTHQADCPYLVGDRRAIASMIAAAVRVGINDFIFDIAPEEADFTNLAACLELARAQAI